MSGNSGAITPSVLQTGTQFGPLVPSGTIEGLQRLFPTFESQLLISLVAIVTLLAVAETVRRLGWRLKNRWEEFVIEGAETALISTLALITGVFLIIVWRATDEVAAAWATLNITRTEIGQAVISLVLLVAAYVLTRMTKRLIHRIAANRGAISGHQREIGHHLIQVTVYTVAGLAVLSVWRIDISNLLIGAGFLGIVLGLAARQTLGAVLAGFVVLFSRPFSLGDWVVIGDNEGIIQEVTIVNTRLKTFDDEVVMIPNDIITSTEVVNRSRTGRLRVNLDVGVDYDTDVERAAAIAERVMAEAETVLDKPDPHVVLAEFGDSAVILRLRFWIGDPNARRKWRAQTEVLEGVREAFADAGIKIPFPQRELMAREETDGFRLSTDGIPTEATSDREETDSPGAAADGGPPGDVADESDA